MPTITRLVQGKKNPNRVNLYLDDSFAFALSIDKVGQHGLKRGIELTEGQVESLKGEDESEYLFAKILNFLSYRPRTIKEVRDRLVKYGLQDKPSQDTFIARLTAKGYLDDLAFARWFIASRNASRARSNRMLMAELRSKGVATSIVQSVLEEIADESVAIRKTLTKKLGPNRALDNVERQKIYAYLSRQGYVWDKIKEVVKSWESE